MQDKELSIKDVRSHGGLSNADSFQTRGGGYSDADVRTFWWKNSGFFEIYGMSVRTRGVGQCGQGRGMNFSRFCADVFYRRPLNGSLLVEKDKKSNL